MLSKRFILQLILFQNFISIMCMERSFTFTERSSEPDTTLSSRVNTADVTLLKIKIIRIKKILQLILWRKEKVSGQVVRGIIWTSQVPFLRYGVIIIPVHRSCLKKLTQCVLERRRRSVLARESPTDGRWCLVTPSLQAEKRGAQTHALTRGRDLTLTNIKVRRY